MQTIFRLYLDQYNIRLVLEQISIRLVLDQTSISLGLDQTCIRLILDQHQTMLRTMIRLLLDEYQTIMTVIRLSLDQHQSMIGLLLDAYQTINRQLLNCVWVCGCGCVGAFVYPPSQVATGKGWPDPYPPGSSHRKNPQPPCRREVCEGLFGSHPVGQPQPPLPCPRGAVRASPRAIPGCSGPVAANPLPTLPPAEKGDAQHTI